jgi:hypothetical protein
MLKWQQLSTLGHSTTSAPMKTSFKKPKQYNTPSFTTHISLSNTARPVHCNGLKKDTAPSSILVAKASKTVDSWLAEDFDFSGFYDDAEGNTDRSVSLFVF